MSSTSDRRAEGEILTQPSGTTPGPWTVDADFDKAIDGTVEGYSIAIPEINRLLHDPDWATSEDWDTDFANAHLIAKAPELYDRLTAISEAYSFYVRSNRSERLTILLCGLPNLLRECESPAQLPSPNPTPKATDSTS